MRDRVTSAPGAAAQPSGYPSRAVRCLLTIWLVFHLAAVIIPPAAAYPTSDLLGDKAWWLVRPYVQLLYLDHGYQFFAPEPGPSTLISYTLEWDDGRTEQEMIPHRGIHPRLLYHRYFMLTEFLSILDIGGQADRSDGGDLELNAGQRAWLRAYARHLCRSRGAQSVSLSRMLRELPSMEDVRNGSTLTDPERLSETPLGTFRCDEL